MLARERNSHLWDIELEYESGTRTQKLVVFTFMGLAVISLLSKEAKWQLHQFVGIPPVWASVCVCALCTNISIIEFYCLPTFIGPHGDRDNKIRSFQMRIFMFFSVQTGKKFGYRIGNYRSWICSIRMNISNWCCGCENFFLCTFLLIFTVIHDFRFIFKSKFSGICSIFVLLSFHSNFHQRNRIHFGELWNTNFLMLLQLSSGCFSFALFSSVVGSKTLAHAFNSFCATAVWCIHCDDQIFWESSWI